VCRVGPAALAVLRAQGNALAVGLHHDHVAVRLLLFLRVAGALLVEVAGQAARSLARPASWARPIVTPVRASMTSWACPYPLAARARMPIE
jgi:hypothetical protein